MNNYQQPKFQKSETLITIRLSSKTITYNVILICSSLIDRSVVDDQVKQVLLFSSVNKY